jgi:hypothetical protein
MTTAGNVSIELRKLADALDKEPEAVMPKIYIHFPCSYNGDNSKIMFLNVARLMPRPFDKKYEHRNIKLEHQGVAADITAWVEQSVVCRIVRPAIEAEYECDPLLSPEEEASLVSTEAQQ